MRLVPCGNTASLLAVPVWVASCKSLGVKDAKSVRSAIATVQVGRVGTAIVDDDPVTLAAVLQGPQGAAILAPSGASDAVKVQDVAVDDARVTVVFDDTSPPAIRGAQAKEWRGFLDIADRLVTVTVRGLDKAPLSDAAGAALLQKVMDGMVDINTTQTVAAN